MPTYQELRSQIEKLQTQAEEQRQKEIKDSIAEIKKKIGDLGLTAADLGLVRTRVAKKAVGGGRKKSVKAKYRDPASGATWTGRGRPPRWIVDAEAKGKKRESFAVG